MDEESLFPEDMEDGEEEMDESQIESEDEPIGYVTGVGFDTDMIRNGQHQIISASGVDSWKQWCVNCLSMERETSPLYSSDFGITTTELYATSNTGEIEDILRNEIEEALMADPYERTKSVDDVSFGWNTDFVVVSVTCTGIDEATIDVTVNIGR